MTEQERKAMNMALHGLLDAREVMILENNDKNAYQDEIEALRQALAQPEQEPAAWQGNGGAGYNVGGTMLAKPEQEPVRWFQQFGDASPKREWVGLHLDDMPDEHVVDRSFLRGARWAEVKLKEKNT